MYKVWLFLFCSLIQRGVDATLTPSGPTVSVDCGGQQTFTCSVTGATAQWAITRLDGITTSRDSGFGTAGSIDRVTTTDANGLVQISTITITGFNTADDGGTIQCVNQLDSAVQGMTTISVGVPSCPTNVRVTDRRSDFSSATITWDQPTNSPPVTSYAVTCNSSCTVMPCTSGSSTCRVVSVKSCEDYSVTVLPMNSCGSSTGCTGNNVAVPLQANCSIPSETSPCPECPLYSLLLLLLLLILVGYSISVALVWHLYYKDYNYCQVYWCCCFCKPREGDGKKRTSSTEPMKTSPPPPPPPAPVAAAAPLGEYADPKDVRKRKEENKIQYADLEFTKQSGGGQGTIHQKEEPVTYTAIQHA